MSGIILADGISRVVLTPSGPAGVGSPTRIDVTSGPFTSIIDAEAWDYGTFCRALVQIHQSLVGTAELTFMEGGHSITITGEGNGKIRAKVIVTDGKGDWKAALTIKMLLDQSYLPDIIQTIKREFLSEA